MDDKVLMYFQERTLQVIEGLGIPRHKDQVEAFVSQEVSILHADPIRGAKDHRIELLMLIAASVGRFQVLLCIES